MTTRRHRALLAAAATGLLAAAGATTTATALAAPLHVLGAADGVTAVRAGGAVELRLAGAAANAAGSYAGRTVTVACSTTPRPGPIFSSAGTTGSSGEAKLARGKDGTLSAKVEITDRAWDTCEIPREDVPGSGSGRRYGPFTATGQMRPPVARVALTAAGAAWIDELGQAKALREAQDRAAAIRPGAPLTAAEVGAAKMVLLPTEDATPPAGSVGYWTDGGQKVAYVAVSAAGRRLVDEQLDGALQRSNVGRFTNSVAELLGTPVIELDTARVDRDRTPSPLRSVSEDAPPTPALAASVSGTRLTLRFASAAARKQLRRVAGRRLSVVCGPAELPADVVDTASLASHFQLVAARAPRRGTVLRVGLKAGRAADVCQVADDGQPVATATPTAAGRALIGDLDALAAILGAELVSEKATAYPSPAALVAKRPKQLVALAGPDAPAPKDGRAGLWTDGGAHAVLAATSRSGHRLVMADEGDGILRDNIQWLLFSSLLLGG